MKGELEALQECKFVAALGAEGIDASTAYVLVDLSDSTNYPHNHTNAILLKSLRLNTEKKGDGIFDVWVGVITEVDASNGTADWLHVFHLEHIPNNSAETTDRFADQVFFGPVNLRIVDGALDHVVTNQQQAGNTNWKTGTGLASPVGAAAGATGKPGAGDLVVWVEEVTTGGTLDFTISADYETL